MRVRNVVLTTALVVLAARAPARAETFLTGFGGATFGGDTDKTRGELGASLGWLSDDGILGLEAMFAYSPNFFGDSNIIGDNNLTTLMAGVIVASRINRGRIYVSAGAGLMKSRVRDVDQFFDVGRNDFGVNVGGGMIGYLNRNVGLRGDLRYFRNVGDPEPDNEFDVNLGTFDYWQATAGLTIRF